MTTLLLSLAGYVFLGLILIGLFYSCTDIEDE